MKKIMIAVCAVAFTAVVQAASVNWGGGISLPDGNTEVSANTAAYLVYSATSFSDTGTLTFDGTSLMNGGTTVATTVDTYTITATDAANWAFSKSYEKAGSDVNGYYAILVADNTAADMTSTAFYSFEVTGTTAQSAAFDGIAGHNWDTDYLTQGGYTVAVPEPTSGLLLLLGMAGLALKRKIA